MRRHAAWVLCTLLVAGCVDFSPALRRQQAATLAAQAGWEALQLPAGEFVLAAFVPRQPHPAATLTVYIEGDGLAWLSRSQVSPDPTPLQPVGLQLALRQPGGAAAYLARPCQYVQGGDRRNCAEKWWTGSRFAADVVTASSLAIDQLKQRFSAQRLVLVGYSGGGAIAALVAAQRHDVALLVTVAGNLDTQTWTKLNKITPLSGSLDPADAWATLSGVAQLHFVGANDNDVQPAVARAYQARFPPDRRPALHIVPGFDHHCCWVQQWPTLYAELAAALPPAPDHFPQTPTREQER
jgi:dienelactone hydrolase